MVGTLENLGCFSVPSFLVDSDHRDMTFRRLIRILFDEHVVGSIAVNDVGIGEIAVVRRYDAAEVADAGTRRDASDVKQEDPLFEAQSTLQTLVSASFDVAHDL